MENLRIIPIMMFLSGALLMYSGFKNVNPMDVLRGNISEFNDEQDFDEGYSSSSDPFYDGIPQYRRPSSSGSSGSFY